MSSFRINTEKELVKRCQAQRLYSMFCTLHTLYILGLLEKKSVCNRLLQIPQTGTYTKPANRISLPGNSPTAHGFCDCPPTSARPFETGKRPNWEVVR